MRVGSAFETWISLPGKGSLVSLFAVGKKRLGRRRALGLMLASAFMVLALDTASPGQGMAWADKGSGKGGSDDGSSGSGGSGSGSSGSDDSGSDDSGSGGSGSGGSGSDDSGGDDSGGDNSGGSGSGGSGSGGSGSGSSGSGGSGSGGTPQPGANTNGGSGSGEQSDSAFYQIQFLDGHFERIQNGTFVRTDPNGRMVEQRPASRRDLSRLNGYRDAPTGSVHSVIVLAPSQGEAEVRDDAGWIEIVQKGTYRLTDPNGNLVTKRKATGSDISRIKAMAGLG